jgi:hypothetical protein
MVSVLGRERLLLPNPSMSSLCRQATPIPVVSAPRLFPRSQPRSSLTRPWEFGSISAKPANLASYTVGPQQRREMTACREVHLGSVTESPLSIGFPVEGAPA